jgi:NAD-dependent SIR2 family protein deacetylase
MGWCIESTSIVLVGAGFSAAATGGDLPLMKGFFDRLEWKTFPELFDFVNAVGCDNVCKCVQEANVERVLLVLDQIRNSPDSLLPGWFDSWKPNVTKMEDQFYDYTLSRLRKSVIPNGNWAADALSRCGPDTTIISMNYDNIAERVLSGRSEMIHGGDRPTCPHCKMRLILERACSCGFRVPFADESWHGALIKLHGSIAWRRCVNPGCCSYQCLVADQHCRPFDPCQCTNCGANCAPVLVMPTMSKNLANMPEISAMWRAAQLAFDKAESLLMFGFSLPTSDELLIQLIRSACNSEHSLKRVASVDLDPEGVLKRFASLLPTGYEVESVALPVERNKAPSWLDRNCKETHVSAI